MTKADADLQLVLGESGMDLDSRYRIAKVHSSLRRVQAVQACAGTRAEAPVATDKDFAGLQKGAQVAFVRAWELRREVIVTVVLSASPSSPNRSRQTNPWPPTLKIRFHQRSPRLPLQSNHWWTHRVTQTKAKLEMRSRKRTGGSCVLRPLRGCAWQHGASPSRGSAA